MTREEAIEELKWLKCANAPYKNLTDAIDMATEALSQPIVAKHFDIQSGYIYCSPQDAKNVKVVVRCKDCKHRSDGGWCGVYIQPRMDTDFCNNGERKGGDDE